jgi:hypothetical protein
MQPMTPSIQRFSWLLIGLILLVGCVRAASDQSALVAPPPPTTDPDVASRQAAATQTTEARVARAGATATAVVADQLAAAETRVAAATATMEVDSTPPFGLIGRQAMGCSGRRVPIELVVEEAEVLDHPEGGLGVVVVVRVTNRGNIGSDLFTALQLQDGRGRVYDYRLADRAIQLYDYQQKYGARSIRDFIQPGLSARQIWGYVVPSDVWGLRIAPGRNHACR